MAKSSDLQTISINLPKSLVKRLQSIKYHSELSVSSIIEKSVSEFLSDMTDDTVAQILRTKGASLRR